MNHKNRRNRRNALVTSILMGIGASQTTTAQEPPAAAKTEKIEVTGSTLKRIEGESALPISVITRVEIEKSGVTSTQELIARLPGISSNNALTASVASGATTGSQSSASLRGLGGDRTLVLVNGRRIANFAGPSGSSSVDVNAIPLAAIERVEVLKDGASAVYGSDAIAGVINFILRKDYEGGEISATAGRTTDGGAGSQRASVLVGAGNLAKDGYSIVGMMSVEKEKPLFGRQRPYAASAISYIPGVDTTSGNTFPANIGFDIGRAIDPITGRYIVAEPGDVISIRTLNPLAPNCTPSVVSPNFPATRCRFDPAGLVSLIPDTERIAGNIFARYRYSPTVELYGALSLTRNKIRTEIQPVPISDQFAIPPNNPLANQFPYNINGQGIPGPASTILLFPSSAFYPRAFVESRLGTGNTPPLFVRYRSVETGNRVTENVNTQYSVDGGVKALLGSWDVEANLQLAKSEVIERTLNGYPLYSRILPILNSGNVNFFGSNTPAVSQALRATNFNGDIFRNESTSTTLGFRGRRDLSELPGGAMQLALGADFRREGYKLIPDDVWQRGDISGYGGQALPVDKERNSVGVVAEIGAPVTKSIELNAAVRFDDYQSVGNTVNPKFAIRWTPYKAVLVRASHGRGFRAPSLYELFAPKVLGTSTVASDPVRCPVTNSASDCATQFITFTGGNPTLKPERSRNSGVGIVLEPNQHLSTSIDWFQVDLRDRIIAVDPIVILNNPEDYPGAVVRTGNRRDGAVQSITATSRNLGEIRMNGIDLDVTLRSPRYSFGRFSAQVAGTYFSKYETQNGSGVFESVIDLGGGPTGGLIPRWRHIVTLDWELGRWKANVSQNFQKSYQELYGNLDGEQPLRRVGAHEVFDAQLQHQIARGLTLTLGMKNIFNRAPPYVVGNGSFQSGYDILYADPRGRFTYLSGMWKFR
jgi:iron complex outermembrane recepter protein